VTISPGLRNPNWASGQSPQAWWGNSTITNSGIENLLVDNSANALRGIVLGPSYKCWVKGVASDDANNYHVFNTISSHNVVRDSYFYWTVYNGTTSYGIGGQTNGDLLMENNILQGIVDPINFDSSCSGCVAGYNFAVNQYYSGSINYLFGIISYHAVGESMILGEGNIGSFPDSDNIHGTHDMNTLYRRPRCGVLTLLQYRRKRSGNGWLSHYLSMCSSQCFRCTMRRYGSGALDTRL
jgi:hypothetical protein